MILSTWIKTLRRRVLRKRGVIGQRGKRNRPAGQHRQVEPLEERLLLTATIGGDDDVAEGDLYAVALNSDSAVDEWEVDWGDGNTQTLAGDATTTSHVFPESGTFHVTAWASAGEGDVFREQSGVVAIEAEHFVVQQNGTGSAEDALWTVHTSGTAVGGEFVRASPNDGVNVRDTTKGPRLDYDVRFDTSGDWFVYVLTRGASGSDNSVHVGINGSPATYGHQGMGDSSGAWTWVDEVDGRDGTDRVKVRVDSPGLHTINLWMREDGTEVDRIVLVKDQNDAPSGDGPTESPRGQRVQSNTLAVTVTDVPLNPVISGSATIDAGGTYVLTLDSTSTPAHGWEVDWGDGSTEVVSGTAVSVSHVYADGGDYQIQAIAFDDAPSTLQEVSGVVSVEAEAWDRQESGTGSASNSQWTVKNGSQASDGRLVKATPNSGVNTGDTTSGARLDYDIRFTQTGTYRVWTRLWADQDADNSVHLGLNGQPVTYGKYGMTDMSGQWTWVGDVANRSGDDAVYVTVDSPGVHTLNLWMREDGVRVDKLVLALDPNFTPTGHGPEPTLGGAGESSNVVPVHVRGLTDGESRIIDFEHTPDGSTFASGQLVADQYAAWGVHFTTPAPASHPLMIFDSSSPTGGDPDLGTPSQAFGGPGIGIGGTGAGANDRALSHLLIISEDGDSSDPDDNASGGTVTLNFDSPVRLDSFVVVDVDESNAVW